MSVEIVIPHNVQVEQAFLGALLMNSDVLGPVPNLKPEHFSEPLHREIFRVCKEMIEAGQTVTPVTLVHRFENFEPIVSGEINLPIPKYIARLASGAISIVAAPGYARVIIDLAARRKLQDLGQNLAVDAANMDIGLSNLAVEAMEQVSDAEAMAGKATVSWTPDMALDYFLSAADQPIITTGLSLLDEYTGGCQPGMFTIIGGRPGMGKTVFAESVARAAAKAGNPVLLFSLEMAFKAMWARFLSDEAWNNHNPIWYGSILRGKIRDYDIQRLRDAHADLKSYPLEVHAKPGLTVGQIALKCRQTAERFAREGKSLKLVIIDHLGNIDPGDRYRGQKVNEIGSISNGLKNLCIELGEKYGTALWAFSQFNRAIESGPNDEDKVPDMSYLRDSGHLEQDARIIFGLYRPAYYKEKALKKAKDDERDTILDVLRKRQNEYQVHILKDDSGALHTVNCSVDIRCSAIRDIGVCATDYYK